MPNSVEDFAVLDEFSSVHLQDFRNRGLTLEDAVRYGIKPAVYLPKRLQGLLIPIYDGKQVVQHQFCNLTEPRKPKYMSIGVSRPSVITNANANHTVYVEGIYKAIVSDCLLKRLGIIANVVGITSKTSYSEYSQLNINDKTHPIYALDSDLSDSERDKNIAMIAELHGVDPLDVFVANYDATTKGFDDLLLHYITNSITPASRPLYVSQLDDLVVAASKVESSVPRFVIDQMLPADTLTVIEGQPGCGKSMLSLAVAGAYVASVSEPVYLVSASGAVRVNNHHSGCKALIVNCEDSESVIATRLRKLSALSLDSCLICRSHLVFPRDLELLRRLIVKNNVGMLVLDPLSNHLERGFSINDESHVRHILSSISDICRMASCTAVVVRHLRKSSGNEQHHELDLNMGLGSIGVAGIARSVIRVLRRDMHSTAILIKSNYSPIGAAFDYNIETLCVATQSELASKRVAVVQANLADNSSHENNTNEVEV
jgi:archaellum biogenesis ATPase FlaH